MFWLIRLAAILYCFFSFSVYAQQNNSLNDQLKAAVCFIHDSQGRVLVIDESIINKFSLPGGYIQKNETPKVAAKRETFEETGIEVDVLNELIKVNRVIIYACQAQSIIPIYNINSSLAFIPFWKASSFNSEVKAAYFMKPSSIMLYKSRFPEQVSLYLDFMKQGVPSFVNPSADFSTVVENTLIEPSFALSMTNFIQQLPSPIEKAINNILRASSWFGALSIFFILLPATIAMGGMKRGCQLMLGLVIVFTIVNVIKITLAIPRPMHFFPEFMQDQAWLGYAFPSMHAAIAFFIWSLVYIWFNFLGKTALYLCIFLGLLTALSRIYIFANQPIDVFVGAVLGIIVALFITLIYKKGWLYSASVWYFLSVINAILVVTMGSFVFLGCAVFTLIYAVILTFHGQTEINLSGKFNLLSFVLSLLGMILIFIVFKNMDAVSNLKIHILVGQSVAILLLTIWISIIIPRIAS